MATSSHDRSGKSSVPQQDTQKHSALESGLNRQLVPHYSSAMVDRAQIHTKMTAKMTAKVTCEKCSTTALIFAYEWMGKQGCGMRKVKSENVDVHPDFGVCLPAVHVHDLRDGLWKRYIAHESLKRENRNLGHEASGVDEREWQV